MHFDTEGNSWNSKMFKANFLKENVHLLTKNALLSWNVKVLHKSQKYIPKLIGF